MKRLPIIIWLFLLFSQLPVSAQQEQVFYRTATSYEKFKWDKLPLAMASNTVIIYGKDSIGIANKTFNNIGENVYITNDGKGYLVALEKGAFIVKDDEGYWTCYYRDKKRIDEIMSFPNYSGQDELEALKEAMKTHKKADPRIQTYYLVYSGSMYKAADSLPVIFVSADSATVGGTVFVKKDNKVFESSSGMYLYVYDKGSFTIWAKDFSNPNSYYVNGREKADQLIAQGYNPKTELANAKAAVGNMENNRTSTVLHSYFNNLISRKDDPALAASIIKYWNADLPGSPASKVIFLTDNLYLAKNSYGIPLWKSISAWVLYKRNGKCYMQWHEYRYEYLGGGTFAKNLSRWAIAYTVEAKTSQGKASLGSGKEFDVDCDIMKKN